MFLAGVLFRHVHGPSWASQRLYWDWDLKKMFQQRLVETGPGVKKNFQPIMRLGSKFFFPTETGSRLDLESKKILVKTRTGV